MPSVELKITVKCEMNYFFSKTATSNILNNGDPKGKNTTVF